MQSVGEALLLSLSIVFFNHSLLLLLNRRVSPAQPFALASQNHSLENPAGIDTLWSLSISRWSVGGSMTTFSSVPDPNRIHSRVDNVSAMRLRASSRRSSLGFNPSKARPASHTRAFLGPGPLDSALAVAANFSLERRMGLYGSWTPNRAQTSGPSPITCDDAMAGQIRNPHQLKITVVSPAIGRLEWASTMHQDAARRLVPSSRGPPVRV